MIQVSSDYISNATSPARQARMSVNVGGHTYGNSVIERLEYSHAIQDGGFSLGGAYSARLHVTLFANGASDIEIGDEVNAYASFDGSGDNCTLGIFYVTNVSQYRNRLKITAYDKIGLLGMTYIYKPASWGGYPGTGNVVLGNILEDILREHNLTKHPNYMMWAAYANTCYCVLKPDYVPKCYSVREMLGFLAGTSGGICTVSRSGYLSLLMPGSPVYLSDTNFHVERDNYYSATIGATPKIIKRARCYSGGGSRCVPETGTPEETVSAESPFGEVSWVDAWQWLYDGVKIYSADITMPALPFLEVGDVIHVRREAIDSPTSEFGGNSGAGTLVPVIIGTLDMVFDGDFTMTITARMSDGGDDCDNTSGVTEVVVGEGLKIDVTDPKRPIISLAPVE